MAEEWYVARGKEKFGPFTAAQLKELAPQGRLLPTDMLHKEGMPKWVPASSVKGLFAANSSTVSPPALPTTRSQPPQEAKSPTSDPAVPIATSGAAALMSNRWFFAKDQKKGGPVSAEQLKELAAAGKIHPSDMLFQEGTQKWIAAGTVEGLFSGREAASDSEPVRGRSHVVYYDNGQIQLEGTLVDGSLHGTVKMYRESGSLRAVATFANGKQDGKLLVYDEAGNKEAELNYERNIQEGIQVYYYPNGQIKRHAHFAKGLERGESRCWDQDGTQIDLMQLLINQGGNPEDLARLQDDLLKHIVFVRYIRVVKNRAVYAQDELGWELGDTDSLMSIANFTKLATLDYSGMSRRVKDKTKVPMVYSFNKGNLDGCLQILYPTGNSLELPFVNGIPNGTLNFWEEDGLKQIGFKFVWGVPTFPGGPGLTAEQLRINVKSIRKKLLTQAFQEDLHQLGLRETAALIDEHRRFTAELKELDTLKSKVPEAKNQYLILKEDAEAKRDQQSQIESRLFQYHNSLGTLAYSAYVNGHLPFQPLFKERLDCEKTVEAWRKQSNDLNSVSGILAKTKAKAQQAILWGKIKWEESKFGSLENSIGKQLIEERKEEAVRCPETASVLSGLGEVRKQIENSARQTRAAEEALNKAVHEWCSLFPLQAVEGASTFDAVLKHLEEQSEECKHSLSELEKFILKALIQENGSTVLPDHPLIMLVKDYRSVREQKKKQQRFESEYKEKEERMLEECVAEKVGRDDLEKLEFFTNLYRLIAERGIEFVVPKGARQSHPSDPAPSDNASTDCSPNESEQESTPEWDGCGPCKHCKSIINMNFGDAVCPICGHTMSWQEAFQICGNYSGTLPKNIRSERDPQ